MNKSVNESSTGAGQPATLRGLPAVHRVLAELSDVDLPRPMIVAVVRRRLDALRDEMAGRGIEAPDIASLTVGIRGELQGIARARIQPVINATGIIIHTNLGRAPLSDGAVRAVTEAARDYVNLEYDLAAGGRGGRGAYLEQSLALLCGSEAAAVVNNCAAALVLVLRHFAARPPRTQVIISRGELVQIGGGFRVPEILEASGAQLREVGTTNKTTLEDYERAVDQHTAMILKVHRSNFYMGGFVESPTTGQIARVARETEVPLVEDLGSGATFDTSVLGGGEREPTPERAIEDGADLVTFSGDKLLGGPQAGIIAGGARYVSALKREPFFRALRCDKLVMAALGATVEALLDGRSQEIPVRQMMEVSVESLRERARAIAEALGPDAAVTIGAGVAQVGGGALPQTVLPSVTIEISGADPEALARRLREAAPPVIGYVADGVVKLDLRTVFPRQDHQLLAAVRWAIAI
jgi:L-seryl-tRNA(Ser) seleniumtransferase